MSSGGSRPCPAKTLPSGFRATSKEIKEERLRVDHVKELGEEAGDQCHVAGLLHRGRASRVIAGEECQIRYFCCFVPPAARG